MSFSERRQLKLIERALKDVAGASAALEQLQEFVGRDLERKEDEAAARKLERASKRAKRG